MSTLWRLDESSSEIYEKYIVPAVSKPWYAQMAELGKPFMKGPVADLACGTGAFLAYLTSYNSSVQLMTGVDANLDILQLAKSRGLPSVNFLEADIAELPFDSSYFNLIFCQQGIQYSKQKEDCSLP